MNNVKVLDIEKHKGKRLFSETMNIQFFDNTINRAEDTNNLKIAIKNSIDLMHKMNI